MRKIHWFSILALGQSPIQSEDYFLWKQFLRDQILITKSEKYAFLLFSQFNVIVKIEILVFQRAKQAVISKPRFS